jgi:hypothetical protein
MSGFLNIHLVGLRLLRFGQTRAFFPDMMFHVFIEVFLDPFRFFTMAKPTLGSSSSAPAVHTSPAKEFFCWPISGHTIMCLLKR